jgi:branched-subunit amino acid aminotransferase/4-amino-4-deoxychorismate lyase
LIDGEPSDGRIEVTDSSVLRGDGCFEVIRSYQGLAFRLQDHIERLRKSADLLEIGLPEAEELTRWVEKTAAELGDGAVRVVVTRGANLPGSSGRPRVIVFGHAWAGPTGPARLLPVTAPWHAAGVDWDLAGAKLISYAPNMAATRRAQREGYDDALLVGVDGTVLEGPTFSVGWVSEGAIETPGLDLGILDSITRRVVFELAESRGVAVSETRAPLSRLDVAAEVFAFSTIREVQPVVAVGDRAYPVGPVTTELGAAFGSLVGEPRSAPGTLETT